MNQTPIKDVYKPHATIKHGNVVRSGDVVKFELRKFTRPGDHSSCFFTLTEVLMDPIFKYPEEKWRVAEMTNWFDRDQLATDIIFIRKIEVIEP